jgi:hypothetical protein
MEAARARPAKAVTAAQREMFSRITIGTSTTRPAEIVKGIIVRLLMLYAGTLITAKVGMSEGGTTAFGILVGAKLRRK